MKSPTDVRDYFEAIATDLGLSFQYGSSERILNRQSSNLLYPCLWLEKPDISHFRSGGLKRVFESAYVVLISCAPDDYEAIDTAQNESDILTEKILNRLEADADAPAQFEFDRKECSSDVIESWSADADTGWRTEFRLTLGVLCETDAYWA